MELAQISKNFQVHSANSPASTTMLASFRARYGTSFEDYISFCEQGTNVELTHSNGAYLRIWEPAYAMDTDEGYNISEYLQDAVPIGDDGNGRVLFYWTGPRGLGLYLCEMGALIPEEAMFVAVDLQSLLMIDEGVDELLLGS